MTSAVTQAFDVDGPARAEVFMRWRQGLIECLGDADDFAATLKAMGEPTMWEYAYERWSEFEGDKERKSSRLARFKAYCRKKRRDHRELRQAGVEDAEQDARIARPKKPKQEIPVSKING